MAPVSLPDLARTDKRILRENVLTFTDAVQPVSYTHLTLPTSDLV